MKKLGSILRWLAFFTIGLIGVSIVKMEVMLYDTGQFKLSLLPIISTLTLLQFARLLYWVVSNVFIHPFYVRQSQQFKDGETDFRDDNENSAHRVVKYIFFLIVGIYMLQNFNIDPALYERNIDGDKVSFRISNILQALLIIFIAQLIVWTITQLLLHNIYKRRDIAQGSQYAINQLIKYVIYIFAIIMALDVFGINMNILLGGAAALLVGIGLGLQQTFIGTVKQIGLRASVMETRGSVSIVVPNHKLVNEKVVNWNHNNDKVRFVIDIGVAYGTDTTLVKKLLLKSVKQNPYVIDYPAPFVRFESFSNSKK